MPKLMNTKDAALLVNVVLMLENSHSMQPSRGLNERPTYQVLPRWLMPLILGSAEADAKAVD